MEHGIKSEIMSSKRYMEAFVDCKTEEFDDTMICHFMAILMYWLDMEEIVNNYKK